jgi:photosystem II stability/assembly factor-like uncharacterized protein
MRGTLVGVVLLLLLLAGCAGGTGSKGGGLPHSPLAAQGLSIDELAVDPLNDQTVYALQVGTLFKTENGGASWRQFNFPGTSLDAFAFVPPRMLYVTGVSTVDVAFSSPDGGTQWRRVRDPFQGPVNSFAVAPSDHRVLYAAIFSNGSGVFKSSDGGRSWRSAGLTGTLIDALAVDPQNPQRVYAVRRGGPFQSQVFKTTDGGRSWQASGTTSLAGEGVHTITVDSQHPRILYAAARDGVFKSSDAGAHWRRDGLRGQAFNQVIISPRNPRRLYAALLDDGVFESSSAGRDWHRLGLANENVGVLAISSDGRVLYAGTDDDGVIVFRVH